MWYMIAIAFLGTEIMRRAFNRRTGRKESFFSFVRLQMTREGVQALHAAFPSPPFNGKNGNPLVGTDWLLVIATLPIGAWWAQTGAATPGIGLLVLVIIIAGVAWWRMSTGRTGETPRRAGPKPTSAPGSDRR